MPRCTAAVLRASDAEGLARADAWAPGADIALPPACRRSARGAACSRRFSIAPVSGSELGEDDIVALFAARGASFRDVCAAADALRAATVGERVSYVVTRNINYTNICYYRCKFCAFSKGKLSENLRGRPYDLDLEEIQRRAGEAWERGATEVCLQGGIHPDYTGATYLAICRAIKDATPGHAHPRLLAAGGCAGRRDARHAGRDDFLLELKAAGLGSLPGTAAEILDDEVRAVICPDKITHRAMARCGRDRASPRPAHDRDHHVRPCRHAAALGAASAAPAQAAGAHRRLHRIRAAAVRADGDADLSARPRAARARPSARRC